MEKIISAIIIGLASGILSSACLLLILKLTLGKAIISLEERVEKLKKNLKD